MEETVPANSSVDDKLKKRKPRKKNTSQTEENKEVPQSSGLAQGTNEAVKKNRSRKKKQKGTETPLKSVDNEMFDLSAETPNESRPNKLKRNRKKKKSDAEGLERDVSKMSLDDATNEKLTPKKKKTKSKARLKRDSFEPYLHPDEVMRGISTGDLIQGEIRINLKKYKEAFLADPENGKDIAIIGIRDRNRALEGDIVVVQLNDESQWLEQNETKQKTAKVVFITEKVHSRRCVGVLNSIDLQYAVLSPKDNRMPRIQIHSSKLPSFVVKNYNPSMCYSARITEWSGPHFAQGVVEKEVGIQGNIDVELESLFIVNELDKNPLDDSLMFHAREEPPMSEALKTREDFRSKCIFSIDPDTAKDLDDALSIEKISKDRYLIGVHISDVSYFLPMGNPLDYLVAQRATSIYLVEKVIHMLPKSLTMRCSLLPGSEKLAFSVLMEVDEQGNVYNTRFTRSVMNSCAQLAYRHAQAVIDGEDVSFPQIYNGVSEETLKEKILILHKIAQARRKTRYDGGALTINQPKTRFILDDHLVPVEVKLEEMKESNRMIEEFMLLANMKVAEHLAKECPKLALLRRHSAPKKHMMEKLQKELHRIGIFLEIESAGDLHSSLELSSFGNYSRSWVLSHFCSKPMQRAVYFCQDDTDAHHYALNMDYYTHFTSPIRRFADVVVHRLLAATLNYHEPPPWKAGDVQKFAANCNKKKNAAKKTESCAADLYTGLYVKTREPVFSLGVVTRVLSYSFEVLLLEFGISLKVYVNELPDTVLEFLEGDLASTLTVSWKTGERQIIQVFSQVRLRLSTPESSLNIEAQLLPPEPLKGK